MKKVICSGIIVLMMMSLCSVAYGASQRTDTKIERGSKNLALGWTEIPKSVMDTTKEKNVLVGLTLGTLEGLFNAVARTISGVADVTTAPMGRQDEPAVKPEMVK